MKVILIRIRNGILYYAKMFVKWIAIALLVGAISGFVGFAFYFMVRLCTDTRIKHEWLIFLMPAGAAGGRRPAVAAGAGKRKMPPVLERRPGLFTGARHPAG